MNPKIYIQCTDPPSWRGYSALCDNVPEAMARALELAAKNVRVMVVRETRETLYDSLISVKSGERTAEQDDTFGTFCGDCSD